MSRPFPGIKLHWIGYWIFLAVAPTCSVYDPSLLGAGAGSGGGSPDTAVGAGGESAGSHGGPTGMGGAGAAGSSVSTGGAGTEGAGPDAGVSPGDACTSESDVAFCARLGKNCGSVTTVDNCGAPRTVADCGPCTPPLSCDGAGTANVCGVACTPESDAAFCSRLGKNCGSVTANDNCGSTRTVSSCGTCSSPSTCGGGGTGNVCGTATGSSLVHRYQFNGTGTQVTDTVGTAHGTVVNAQLSGNGSVVLAGGVTDQYVDLPNGIIRQLTNATFEAWVTWNGAGGWERIFDFGDAGRAEGVRDQAATSFYLTPRAMIVPSFPGPEVMLAGFKRANQISDNELKVLATQAIAIGTMVHVAVVVDDTNNQIRLYKDGAPEASATFVDALSSLNDINVWLGRSQYAADHGFGGTIYKFRIYNSALSQAAIQASFLAGTDPPSLMP